MPKPKPPEEVSQEEFRIIRARLGIEAESFERSHVGQYIYDQIDIDLDKFQAELLATSPHDVEKCVEIRNNILVRNLFTLWIQEAIRSGLNAEYELNEADKEDY